MLFLFKVPDAPSALRRRGLVRATVVVWAVLPTLRTSANAGDQLITPVSSSLGESVEAHVVFQT